MGHEEPQFGRLGLNARTPVVRFEKQICVGSIGTFWNGRLLAGGEAGRPVLLRRIPKDELQTGEIQAIHKAGRAYGKLQHPSFVKLLGIIEQDLDLITINEHLVSVPILELLRECIDTAAPLPANVSLRMVLDAAQATAMAHRLSAEAGLFPSNRLFLPEGVFIAAFGGTLLSEIGTLSMLSRCERSQHIPDLLAQLSPEELTADATSSGCEEVFSLGVLLWQGLANQWLFELEHEATTRAQLASLRVPSLETIDRYGMPVPKALVDLVDKATKRQPDERFSSVAEFIEAILRLPNHFVATEHQVADALRQRAQRLLHPTYVDDAHHAASGTFSEVPPSRTPTRPPAADAFGSEPPTFAQSRLITAFPPLESFDDPNGTQTPSDIHAPAITADVTSDTPEPRQAALVLAPRPQLLPFEGGLPAQRHKGQLIALAFVTLLLAIGAVLFVFVRRNNTSQDPSEVNSVVPIAPDDNARKRASERFSLSPDPHATQTFGAHKDVIAPNQQNPLLENDPANTGASAFPNSTQPLQPKKTKPIGPYRPKGI